MRALDEQSLDALMARLSHGDRSAFDPLFVALQPRALRFASARLDPVRAADVAQSALLNVFARAHEFEAGRSALAWFYGIVANEIRAAQRRTRSHEAVDESLPAAEASPEQRLLERELERALEHAVSELDPYASEAIGAMLGRTERPPLQDAALRKRVSRAYARLRILLGDLR